MIKLVIFDLDGVLIETKDAHFHILNKALATIHPTYTISYEEHLKTYDALPTIDKLEILHERRGLPRNTFNQIIKIKQEETVAYIRKNIMSCDRLTRLMKWLKDNEYSICVASNSVKNTVYQSIKQLAIQEYIDYFVSSQDIAEKKPSPEMYEKCMKFTSCRPEETLILEDSPVGLQAVYNSGAHLLQIHSLEDVNITNVESRINEINAIKVQSNLKWNDEKLNVLIPMAGLGDRFRKAGYTVPKPLVPINDIPMINRVVDSLNINANYIFIVQQAHYEMYNLNTILNMVKPGCTIVQVDGLTEGAACTTLLAKKFIDNDNKLLIVNSDQILYWDSTKFMYNMEYSDTDAGILTFNATETKWSYAKTDDKNNVLEVAEKTRISNNATVGVYYWKRGRNYVKSAEQMISKNIRTNGEFYVCPAFNQAIERGLKVKSFQIPSYSMHGVGTPEDLNKFIDWEKNE